MLSEASHVAFRGGSEGDLAFLGVGGASDSWCSTADVNTFSLSFHCDLHVGDSSQFSSSRA